MTMCAGNIQLKDILKLRRESLADKVEAYLHKHLSDPTLSIQDICREFGISRGTLYTVSKEAFGTGITVHLRCLRIQKAIALVRQGTVPNYRIAEEVGFGDPNYLAKVIKAQTGQTPRKMKACAKGKHMIK